MIGLRGAKPVHEGPDPSPVVLHQPNLCICAAGATGRAAQCDGAVDLEQQRPWAWLGRTVHPAECLACRVESYYYVIDLRDVAGRFFIRPWQWQYLVQEATVHNWWWISLDTSFRPATGPSNSSINPRCLASGAYKRTQS